MFTIYTIGHSNHSIGHFILLLQKHDIKAVVDVRSSPYSHYTKHFNKDNLSATLADNNIYYIFMGDGLGARPADKKCYREKKADYELIAQTNLFKESIGRVLKGANDYKLVLMCAEKEPLDCHRSILVARHLIAEGATVKHIHSEGTIETHSEAESRLLKMTNQINENFLEDPLQIAYEIRANDIMYRES